MDIEHPKIASLSPSWASYSGCSIIFDHFGTKNQSGVSVSTAGSLHGSLHSIMAQIGFNKWKTLGFCPLPLRTFHLTLADLVHAGNVSRLGAGVRDKFLDNAKNPKTPASIASCLNDLVKQSGILTEDTGNIGFSFAGIANRNNRVLVAELVPDLSPENRNSFEQLMSARRRLQQLLKKDLDLELPDYRPHITLGYFASRSLARESNGIVKALAELAAPLLEKGTFRWGPLGLYSFSSMIAFEKVTVPP